MQELTLSRIASALTIVVGAWLLLSPVFISLTGGALVNLFITGGVIAALGIVQLLWENALPSWVNMLAAVWLFIAAFLFSASTGAVWNMAVAAVIIFVLATWDGFEMDEVHRRHHAHI